MTHQKRRPRQQLLRRVAHAPCSIVLFAFIGMFGLSGCIVPVPAEVTSQSGPRTVSEPLAADEKVVVLGNDDFATCVREELIEQLPKDAVVALENYDDLEGNTSSEVAQLIPIATTERSSSGFNGGVEVSRIANVRFEISIIGTHSEYQSSYFEIGSTFSERAHVQATILDLKHGVTLEPITATATGDGFVSMMPFVFVGGIAPVVDAPACHSASEMIIATIAPDPADSDAHDGAPDGVVDPTDGNGR